MHLIRFGSEREAHTYPEAWFDQLCREAVEHGWLCNTAATEEGLGSPAGGGAPETTAVESEGGWLINGRKTFTTMAPLLHSFIVMASIPQEGTERPAIGNFMLYRDDPGFRVEETWDSLGMRSTGSHDIVLDNVQLGPERLMTRRNPGSADPRGISGFVWFALGLSATTIGVARAARDYAVGYARERTPNSNRTIKEYPGVRTRIARIDILLQRSRALVFDAAAAWESRSEPRATLPGMSPADRVAVAKVETLQRLYRSRRPRHARCRRGQPPEEAPD